MTGWTQIIADQLDYCHQYGGVSAEMMAMRCSINEGIETLGECNKDPVWNFMQKLDEDEWIAARDYMRKKYHSIEPKYLLPGTAGVKMSKSTRRFWRQMDQ